MHDLDFCFQMSLRLSSNGGTMAVPPCWGSAGAFIVGSIRTVVVATDFSFSAHRAARRAGVIAKESGAALHLLHVLDHSPIQALLRRSPAFDVEKPLILDAQRSLDSLAEDVASFAGVVSARIVREGRVMDEILAGTADADLLVLGPRGINPVRDLILGSTAERIARTLECPMLVVKQEPQIKYENVVVPVDFSDYSLPAMQFIRARTRLSCTSCTHSTLRSNEGCARQGSATKASRCTAMKVMPKPPRK